MEKGYFGGETVEDMRGIIMKIKNMDMGCLNGRMEEGIKGNGGRENNMEGDCIWDQMGWRGRGNGRMGRKLGGLVKKGDRYFLEEESEREEVGSKNIILP